MSGVSSLKIFGELTDEVRSKHAVAGVPGLYLEHGSSRSSRSSKKNYGLFSATLFLFPKRAEGPYGHAYADMVRMYLRGLKTAIANMDRFPGWKYRLYVDRSACVGTGAIKQLVPEAVDALAREHPRSIEVVGVRYEREGYADGSTFLPAAWRFLPLLDASCEAFCCWDADSPPHPIFSQRIEAWLRSDADRAQQLLYFPQPFHATAWCAMFVASALSEGPGGAAQHAMCPWAQLWAARRVAGSTLFSESTVARMLELTHSTATQDLLGSIGRSDVDRLAAAASASVGDFRGMVADTRAKVAADPAAASSAWAGAVVRDDRAAAVATALVHRDLGRRLKKVYGARVAFVLDDAFRRKMPGNLRTLADVAVDSGYGVDEWVQHLVMCAVGHQRGAISFVTYATPKAGVSSAAIDYRSSPALVDAVVGARLTELAGRVVAVAPDAEGHARRMLSELAWRTGAALAFVRAVDGDAGSQFRSTRDAYVGRIAKLVTDAATPETLSAFLSEDATCRRAFLRLARKTGALSVNAREMDAWVRSKGGRGYSPERDPPFDFGGSREAFRATFDVAVRALLLSCFSLYKCVAMEPGPVAAWWS